MKSLAVLRQWRGKARHCATWITFLFGHSGPASLSTLHEAYLIACLPPSSPTVNCSSLLGFPGLLETDSSVSEKSEQYFAELQEFRLVNKEACVYEQCLE